MVFGNAKAYLQKLAKFIGPGFMIAVGYLDPGNWATDMEGGSKFGYRLLFVILISNVIAVFLQNLTIRLGTVTGLDLAAASRRFFPRWLNLFLYILAEAAIIATDLAEVIGSAIALNLLFPRLPLPAGVAITAADVFIVLLFYNEEAADPDSPVQTASVRLVRFFEWFVMLLVAAVGICFVIELAYSDIVAVDLLKGYLPTREIFTDSTCLYVAIGIIGATVMPHNLYLHSFIVQARCQEWRTKRPRVTRVGEEGWTVKTECQPLTRQDSKHIAVELDHSNTLDVHTLRKYLDTNLRSNLHYGFVDLIVALSFAFFVNCAILIVASANFYYGPSAQQEQVEDLFSAHDLLYQYVGPPAAVVFALALLCAGQSSTLTATLAGQVVMSGFLGMTTRPWIRRVVTRLIAIVPAMVAACIGGRTGLSQMLIGSQVALSIQLPFAVIPLVYFTAKKHVMKLELVVEHNPNGPTVNRQVAWIDQALPSWSVWCRYFPFEQLDRLYQRIVWRLPKSTSKTEKEMPSPVILPNEVQASGSPDIVLEDWPEHLAYPNGRIVNAFAILVTLLLLGLNGYLVVSTILGN